MGLLDNTTQQSYYQGNNFGNYQFTSLNDIIDHFMLVYVGEDKIISNARRVDVAFHAQRALQELSFDVFKSCKSQEILLPGSLQMILPHDYVNYTKLSWVDSSGIKHPLYPTKHTSNPFDIEQDDDGNYKFPAAHPVLVNADFEDTFGPPWFKSEVGLTTGGSPMLGTDTIAITSGELTFTQHVHSTWQKDKSRIYCAWQQVDVSDLSTLELSILRDPLSNEHFAPTISINLIIVRVSLRSGTRFIILVPSAIRAAVIIGKTAFFAPLILTVPVKGF